MAHGKNTVFKVDDSGGTLRDLSAYCDNVDFPRDQSSGESTGFAPTSGSRTYEVGLNGATISIAGKWTSAANAVDVVLAGLINPTAGASSTFEYGPEGGTSGKIRYTGECFLTQYQSSSPLDGVVTFSAQFQVTGAVTRNTFP